MSRNGNGNGLSRLGVSLVRVSDSQLAISGDMLFASATRLRAEGEKLLPGMAERVTVDLSQVGRVGSVGISVLMCWLRMAQVLGKTLVFVNAPDDMLDVSRVSSLDSVIPFSS
ncbi:MAG: hypothetical protein CMK83_14370 [Pseudomonadales bacterium]|jgi:phospholipid transport system transporter-binding protein|uniref:STAS domain-containing protein n=1 Tax=unclassified Ketobacter TaxID=2639109 RepID=UPI000C422CC4|nr:MULTISPECIES: STAS domain-containing protein [unclassified Ketobacter]MAQ25389.1 hypothetical protein [Pseudomonadales bacterium]MEC8811103.1 STAS domain-containing protein [Pseudomonadota bacterium]TNC88609.1 MAG: hypothetical protein CSH49_10740 [Alcanivorax sp.]HAG94268.1 hypothetical protein [Gammaproteobacteria bacterium]MBI25893.1 hypothetical protein [Pseudomonadales bacterium]|tara:strand:+ start:272 stop:610 length:339 start_codon:yes stop_codon:yes gene_type:complete